MTKTRPSGFLRVALASVLIGTVPLLAAAQTARASASAPASMAAADAAAVTTPSGLVYKTLREGRGASPGPTDSVKVNYRGTFPDGREFDSSYARHEPAVFPLDHVIKCWTEAVQRMKPGGKAHLVCPPQIAYGERGAGGVIPANATLYFEVELLEVNPH
jgi:FKBP-type peptidyl-prolyl cis-trans isomerase FkpA